MKKFTVRQFNAPSEVTGTGGMSEISFFDKAKAETCLSGLRETRPDRYADIVETEVATVHVPKKVLVVLINTYPAVGTIEPRIVTTAEQRWMLEEIRAEHGTPGLIALNKGEYVEIPGYVLWQVDLGEDVEQNEVTEGRERKIRAERAAKPRTEWHETV